MSSVSVRKPKKTWLPAFLAEIEGPAYRARLAFSVKSGLFVIGVFAIWALSSGRPPMFLWPVGLKLATNTASWYSLRVRKHVLAAAAANVLGDVFAMTWAIYMTGGVLSPLFCIYAIELTVVALLSNVGTTVLVAVIALVHYVTMVMLVHFHVLPGTLPPAASQDDLTTRYVVINCILNAFVLGIPTFFTASILKQLRVNQVALDYFRSHLAGPRRCGSPRTPVSACAAPT